MPEEVGYLEVDLGGIGYGACWTDLGSRALVILPSCDDEAEEQAAVDRKVANREYMKRKMGILKEARSTRY